MLRIDWSPEDNGFIARDNNHPGIVVYGSSLSEAEYEFERVLAESINNIKDLNNG